MVSTVINPLMTESFVKENTEPKIILPTNTIDPNVKCSCIVRLFSIGGAERATDIVFYVMFDWASKVTNISFNISFPLLVADLGDAALGDGQGKVLYSYLIIVIAILTSLSFLTFTSEFDFGHMKRKAIFRFGALSGCCLILFIFCFSPGALVIACGLVILSKVCNSIAYIAYDSLLDAVAQAGSARDPHTISSRAYITGYSGMMVFIVVVAAPVLGVIYTVNSSITTLWFEGIIPTVLSGIWYVAHIFLMNQYLPRDLGEGIPFIEARDLMKEQLTAARPNFSVSSHKSKFRSSNLSRHNTRVYASSVAEDNRLSDLHRSAASKHESELSESPWRQAATQSLENEASVEFTSTASPVKIEDTKTNEESANSHLTSINELPHMTEYYLGKSEDLTQSKDLSKNAFEMEEGTPFSNGKSLTETNKISQMTKSPVSASTREPTFAELVQSDAKDLWLIIRFGLVQGARMQYENVKEVHKFKDLSLFIIAFIFLNGASTTAQSVAAIVATQILNASVETIIAGTVVGLVAAIASIWVFKMLIFAKCITPKWVLVINVVVLIFCMMYVLYIKTVTDMIVAAAIIGVQIGPIGALTRSIVSSQIPTKHQSRLFSLYQFSQDSTSWIGSLVIASVAGVYGGSDYIYLRSVVYVVMVEIGLGLPFLLLMNQARGRNYREKIDREESYGIDVDDGMARSNNGTEPSLDGIKSTASGNARSPSVRAF